YWDTTVLIAWLIDERKWPQSVLDGIQDLVYAVETNEIVLFTSSLTRTEVYMGQLSLEQKQKYAELMRRRNMREVAADARVTDRASSIREYYKARGVNVRTPDAIHLATAIIYQADELHTLDGFENGGKRRTGLLRFNGDVAGFKLTVVAPYPRRRPPAETVGIPGPLFQAKRKIDLGDDPE